jgi:hypothetical protein
MADIRRMGLIINMIVRGIDTLAISGYMVGEDLSDTDLRELASATGLSFEELEALRDDAQDDDLDGDDDDDDDEDRS